MAPPSSVASRRLRLRRHRRAPPPPPMAQTSSSISDARSNTDQSVPGERSQRQGAPVVSCADLGSGDLFPQRREEGLRDGTLRELFQEEIKKSQEEYIDQVGREFAESTTHFQDALNEILAAGRKMF